MKILLTSPPCSLCSNNESDFGFPSGAMSLASLLKSHKKQVSVFFEEPYTPDTFSRAFASCDPDVVGFTCYSTNFKSCLELAGIVTRHNRRTYVVLGGIHASLFPEKILCNCRDIDYVISGDSEPVFPAFLKRLEWGADMRGLPGVSFRKGCGEPVINKGINYVVDMDTVPPFDYSLVDMNSVTNYALKNNHDFYPVFTSRGCVFRCAFCAYFPSEGKRCRAKSVPKVISELKHLRDTYGVNKIHFHDPTFTFNRKRTYEICRQIKKAGLGISWYCSTRVDCVDKRLISCMEDAGCSGICFGVESFSPLLLKAMHKCTEAERSVEILNYVSRIGMRSRATMVIGYPGENTETLRETLRAMKRVNKDVIFQFNHFQLYPGSRIYEYYKQRGVVNDEMWFSGFSPKDFLYMLYTNSFIRLMARFREEMIKLFPCSDKG